MPLQVLQGKVQPEVFEQWKKAQEESEALTFNQFVEMVLESFLNPKTKEIIIPTPTEDQQREIQLKENEIGRLKTAFDLDKTNLETEISDRDQTIKLLRAQLSELQNLPPENVQLDENQILITVPPVVAAVLDKEIQAAEKKGRQFSRQEILLNTFWDGIVNGQSYPFRVWTSGDLQRIKKQLETVTNGN